MTMTAEQIEYATTVLGIPLEQLDTAPEKPKPFADSGVRRLSRKDARERGYDDYYSGSSDQIDSWVAGHYGLAPGSVFVTDEAAPEPVTFVGNANGRRTSIVVAREYGDITWPAFLAQSRAACEGEGGRIVREGLADVIAWLEAADEARAAAEFEAYADLQGVRELVDAANTVTIEGTNP